MKKNNLSSGTEPQRNQSSYTTRQRSYSSGRPDPARRNSPRRQRPRRSRAPVFILILVILVAAVLLLQPLLSGISAVRLRPQTAAQLPLLRPRATPVHQVPVLLNQPQLALQQGQQLPLQLHLPALQPQRQSAPPPGLRPSVLPSQNSKHWLKLTKDAMPFIIIILKQVKPTPTMLNSRLWPPAP